MTISICAHRCCAWRAPAPSTCRSAPSTIGSRPSSPRTLEGQGASGEPVLQAGIPFLVQGPFASPSVRFDLNGTLTSAISSPEDLARVAADLAQSPQAVQVLRDQFDLLDQLPAPAAGKARDLIEGVLGGGGDAARRAARPRACPTSATRPRGCSRASASKRELGAAAADPMDRAPPRRYAFARGGAAMTDSWHLAQLNIARPRAPLDHPIMAEFMANLERINALGDASPGFVWRLQDDSGNATALEQPFGPEIIVNMTVWEDVEALRAFVFRSEHTAFLRRRAEWFDKLERPDFGAVVGRRPVTGPSLAEARSRLDRLAELRPDAGGVHLRPTPSRRMAGRPAALWRAERR